LQNPNERNTAFVGGKVRPSLKERLANEAALGDRTVLGQLRLILRERYVEADNKKSAAS
jgi:hypothetical protein